ncbi:VOC family protein [Phytomonospora sp. NPDC050363]|uniref:VOC family protein n=1 Tax=Phytomonospora sp. NPDC050363 TaxID=3155642 RepID=UPI0033FDA32E
MRFTLMGTALMSADPQAAARWFTEHFGFTVGIDVGWYVNAQHSDHPNVALDFVDRDHESLPAELRGASVAGTLLGLLVEDVDAEDRRLRAAGLDVVLPLATEPWGQRRVQFRGPDGVIVEILQMVEPDPRWLADNGLA